MKRILTATAALAVALSGVAATAAHADSDRGHGRYDERHGGKHYDRGHHNKHRSEWRKGHRMARDDWRRGHRIDYRHYRLSAPPRGYEWREVDGDYVLAAVATGLILSVILNN